MFQLCSRFSSFPRLNRRPRHTARDAGTRERRARASVGRAPVMAGAGADARRRVSAAAPRRDAHQARRDRSAHDREGMREIDGAARPPRIATTPRPSSARAPRATPSVALCAGAPPRCAASRRPAPGRRQGGGVHRGRRAADPHQRLRRQARAAVRTRHAQRARAWPRRGARSSHKGGRRTCGRHRDPPPLLRLARASGGRANPPPRAAARRRRGARRGGGRRWSPGAGRTSPGARWSAAGPHRVETKVYTRARPGGSCGKRSPRPKKNFSGAESAGADPMDPIRDRKSAGSRCDIGPPLAVSVTASRQRSASAFRRRRRISHAARRWYGRMVRLRGLSSAGRDGRHPLRGTRRVGGPVAVPATPSASRPIRLRVRICVPRKERSGPPEVLSVRRACLAVFEAGPGPGRPPRAPGRGVRRRRRGGGNRRFFLDETAEKPARGLKPATEQTRQKRVDFFFVHAAHHGSILGALAEADAPRRARLGRRARASTKTRRARRRRRAITNRSRARS